MKHSLYPILGAIVLAACSAPPRTPEANVAVDFLTTPVRESAHHGDDDLLTAGLGLPGLRGAPAPFADAQNPTPQELRRRAIQSNWKGIADLGPLGRYGELYGSVANVPGREYQAFAQLPHAHAPHRVLAQIPDNFDKDTRCLIVTASSGSRGVYGAIALAGAWGLPHGCAVAYTDKGNGTGYFDLATATGTALDGTRAAAGSAALEFTPDGYTSKHESGIATKHAHSGDNPEADWGRHVLQAARFGLAMLDRAYPQGAPYTALNTRIIAVGVSNGAGAVLQAAGIDDAHLLSGVVALAPNVNVPGARAQGPLYDYTTDAALLMPCALSDARFDAVPFARIQNRIAPMWTARCASLHAHGLLHAAAPAAQAAEALERLHASGWSDAALATAASSTAFDLWRAIAVTYASSYARSGVGNMPCGFRFASHTAPDKAPAERAAWWADASGIPPGAGVVIEEAPGADAADPTLNGLLCLRQLWTADGHDAAMLRASVAATAVALPRKDLPVWVIHGSDDGLLPVAFNSAPYVEWLHANGRAPLYWPIPHAQHFDAFLALPAFGDRYVPLLPYGYAALDRMFAHVVHDAPLPQLDVPHTLPRGAAALDAKQLGL